MCPSARYPWKTGDDLDKITRIEPTRTKLKVFKYGPNLSKEYSIILENAERPALTTNRAGAPTETAHMELVAELKQNFSDVYVAQDNQYWSLWATLIQVEKDPQRREMYKSSLPVQLCQFFNSPAHMADGGEQLSRTRQANSWPTAGSAKPSSVWKGTLSSSKDSTQDCGTPQLQLLPPFPRRLLRTWETQTTLITPTKFDSGFYDLLRGQNSPNCSHISGIYLIKKILCSG